MTLEQIFGLAIGVASICFGMMLMPFANAMRRRMLASREPPPVVEFTVMHRVPRGWRSHVIPVAFVLLGVASVAFAVFGA